LVVEQKRNNFDSQDRTHSPYFAALLPAYVPLLLFVNEAANARILFAS
jgi:hypothetical protein